MAISGHEEEFRRLFAEEAETRLQRLATELLQLEEAGSDADLVASIFRDAHTLKGAAGMVGLTGISRIAHVMEDLLEELRAGRALATPELIDPLLVAVDGLRTLIPALLAGEDRIDDMVAIEGGLRSVREGPAAPEPELGPAPAPARVRESRLRRHSIESVRVPVSRLDELVRLVGESAAAHVAVGRMLAERFGTDPAALTEFRELSRVIAELQSQTMRVRMVPVATVTDSLQRALRDLARTTGKTVRWEVHGEDTELDREVLEQLAEPLVHLVRNAVDHGIETAEERKAAGKAAQAVVRLDATQVGSEVVLVVSDDGRGIDLARVREEAGRRGSDASMFDDREALYLIFRSGLSTAEFISDVSGRGVGLDIVKRAVDATRGRIEVRSTPGEGTEFRIVVPITLAVQPCLVLEVSGSRYAVPMHSVLMAEEGEPEATSSTGDPAGQAVPVSDTAAVLGLPGVAKGPTVVLSSVTRRHAFRVDALLGKHEIVVKSLGRLLPRLEVWAGAGVEPDGSVLLVLDAPGLIDRARASRHRRSAPPADVPAAPAAEGRGSSILVVDDARAVRELHRSILERAGYEVRVADNGVEAFAQLAECPSDLVLTDVEMPGMDGFALVEAIRADPSLGTIPVLILTSRWSDDDRRRGLGAGADGYIVKSPFDESAFLGAVERLLGRP